MKLSYQNMILPHGFDGYTDDQVIDLFDKFLKVDIFDTKTGVSHSYPINPMRKVHNKMVVSDELSKGYFSGAQPFTDKKGLCDFLQHFLLLASKEDICFAVYQNDLMSVIFHILTMIAVCESGTTMGNITAVLYCPLRVLVFRIIPTGGSYTYELDCVRECTDDTVEDEDGDFDDDTQTSSSTVQTETTVSTSTSSSSSTVPFNPTNGSGGGGRMPMKGGTVHRKSGSRRSKAKSSMQRSRKRKIPHVETNHETPPKFSNEVFDFIQKHDDPRLLFLAFKYKYYKSNQLTTETLEEFIANDNSPSNPGSDPSPQKTIGVDPILFRDREFIYYQYLKRWMVHEFRWDETPIKELNHTIDHAFEMERDLRMQNERLMIPESNSPIMEQSMEQPMIKRRFENRKNSIEEGLPRAYSRFKYTNQTKRVRAKSLTPGPRSGRALTPGPFKRSPMPISGPRSAPKSAVVDQ